MAGSWNMMPEVNVHRWKVTSYITLTTLLSLACGNGVPTSIKTTCEAKYEKIKDAGCSTEGGFSQQQAMEAMRQAYKLGGAKGTNMSLYLTSVVVNLTQIEKLETSLQPTEGDTFKVQVYLGSSTSNGNVSIFQYRKSLGFTVYRALLNPPIKVYVNTNFRFTVHLNETNWHPANISLHHFLSTTYIDVYDFCTGGMHKNCSNLVKDMYQPDHRECGYIDKYDFVAKYWYCQNNSAPYITKQTDSLPWDDIREKQQSGPVFGDSLPYVHDHESRNLEYQLVHASYETPRKRDQSVSTTSQYDCTDPSLSVNYTTPPYFCIDKANGTIYSTQALIQNIEPIDDFNLSIHVKDFDGYPPRMISTNIVLRSVSVCRKEFAAFRALEDCDNISYNNSNAYNVTMMRADGAFTLDTSSIEDLLQNFYISGIYSKQTVMNNIDEGYLESGNLTITLLPSLPQTQKAEAKFYHGQLGKYVSFSPPIRYKVGDKFTVSSTLDDEMLTVLQDNNNNVFQPDQWTIVLIEDKENDTYCSQTDCTDSYKRYADALSNSLKCENYDVNGFDAKYGYCQETKIKYKPHVTPNGPIKEHDNITITDCKYESQLEASDVYWLKDGHQRLEISDRDISVANKDKQLHIFNVPDYVIKNVKKKDQGFYQCVVRNRGSTVSSKEVSVKIKGHVIYMVSMTLIKKNWTSKYAKTGSTKYNILEKAVINSVVQLLDKVKSRSTVEIQNFERATDDIHVQANLKIYMIANSKKERRLPECVNINNNFSGNITVGNFTVINSKIINFGCCTEESKGDDNFRGRYTYKDTVVGVNVSKDCKYHNEKKKSKCNRKCMYTSAGAKWSNFDVSACKPKDESTGKLMDITKTKVTKKNVAHIAEAVANISKGEGAMMNPVNIALVTKIVTNVVNVDAADKHVATNIISCIGSIVATGKKTVAKSEGSSAKILNSLEIIAKAQKPSKPGNFTTIGTPHLALGVLKPRLNKNLTIYSPRSSTGGKIKIKFRQGTNVTSQSNEASITLPEEVVNEAGDDAIYSYVFQKDSLFQSGNGTSSLGYIMSATIGDQTIVDQSIPITLEFALQEKGKGKGNTSCKFWKPNHKDASGHTINGSWSTDGCNTTLLPNNRVSCSCDHLTNFGILFDVEEKHDSEALSIISTIGCAISIVGLVITIISNVMFKDVRKKVPSKILVNLSLALMMMLIIFMCGAEKPPPASVASAGCRTVAALIQYFMLATFFWMAIEGVNLYRNFVKVFTGGSSTSKFLRICYAVGWGGPLIITASTAAARWENMGPATSKDGQFCVVQGIPFRFAVLLPICIILVGNYIVLILVLRGINRKSPIQSDTPREKSKKMRKVRVAMACATLLGSTWVSGLLAVGILHDAFQWMFAITISLQGAFLFYFYTFTNKKIREEWVSLMGSRSNGNRYVNSHSSVVSRGSDAVTRASSAVSKGSVMRASSDTLTSTTDTLNSSRDLTMDTSRSSGIPSFPKFKTKRADGKKVNRKTT